MSVFVVVVLSSSGLSSLHSSYSPSQFVLLVDKTDMNNIVTNCTGEYRTNLECTNVPVDLCNRRKTKKVNLFPVLFFSPFAYWSLFFVFFQLYKRQV